MSSPAAVAGDEQSARQVVRFIARPKGGDLYSVLSLPAGPPPSRIVLVCQPTFEEHGRAYPIIREAARWLCARGMGVLRFDYFATGDSSGDSHEFSMSSAVEDITFLARQLMEQFPSATIVPLGVRLGSRFLLDALAPQLRAKAPRLATPILWDPVLDAREHVLSELRATIASAMIVYAASVASREEIIRETLEHGVCERGAYRLNQIDGYAVTQQLLRDVGMGTTDPWTFDERVAVIVTTPSGDGQRQRDKLHPILPRMEFHPVKELPYWSQPPLYSQRREQLYQATEECIEQCR